MKNCIFTFYNYETEKQVVNERIRELEKIAGELGVYLEHLRYNLPNKYIPIEKIIEYAVPQLFGSKGYDKIVAFDIKNVPTIETIKEVLQQLETNTSYSKGECLGLSKVETQQQEYDDTPPKVFNPFGSNLLTHTVPKNIFELLKQETENIRPHLKDDEFVKRNSHADYVVGKNSYQIRLSDKFISEVLQNYLLALGNFYLSEHKQQSKLTIGNVWINYSYAGDSNPLHTHDALLSGVIYVKQDESIYKEIEEYTGRTRHGIPGATHFVHKLEMNRFDNNVFSNVTKPGDVVMFPSWLTHYVNAHRCEGERITVAFNILEA